MIVESGVKFPYRSPVWCVCRFSTLRVNCSICAGTGRDPIPWSEIGRTRDQN